MGLPSREQRRRALVLVGARLCRPRVEETTAHAGPAGGEQKMRLGDVLGKLSVGDVLHGREDFRPFNQISTAIVTSPNSNRSGSDGTRRGGRRRRNKGASSPSPRCLLSRWLPSKHFLKCRSCEGEYEEEEEEAAAAEEEAVEGEGGCVCCVSSLGSEGRAGTLVSASSEDKIISTSEAMATASRGGQGPVYSEERKMKDSVHHPEQTFLNIGMGAGLVFLLSRSITEFSKMTELRREMEILLKEVKDTMQKHDSSPNPAESKNTLTLSYSDSPGDTEQSNNLPIQDCLPCLKLPEAPCIAEHDSYPNYKNDHMDARSLSCQMEAGLESELEILKPDMDKQDSSQQLLAEFSDKRTEVSEGFSVNLHTGQKERVEKEVSAKYQHGVCPHELTRRLHELLEARREERITELESALQLAHIKLREKEMEASWWRDTAGLASQQKQETLFR